MMRFPSLQFWRPRGDSTPRSQPSPPDISSRATHRQIGRLWAELDYATFRARLGLADDDYGLEKWRAFQQLGLAASRLGSLLDRLLPPSPAPSGDTCSCEADGMAALCVLHGDARDTSWAAFAALSAKEMREWAATRDVLRENAGYDLD